MGHLGVAGAMVQRILGTGRNHYLKESKTAGTDFDTHIGEFSF